VPIAEWVLATMLAFEKKLPGSWVHSPPAAWGRGTLGTLAGRTLGLAGFGGIGRAVAERALAFDMHVRALRRTDASLAMAGVTVATSLTDLVASADHLVLALPLTSATHHVIGPEIFAAMKPGAHLVNIARGGLVDQEALRVALDDGRVAMASLDAVDPEPLPAGHWLYAHPRVRLSPHVSWNMPNAGEVLVEAFIDNVRRYRRGEALVGVVDVQAGY
jgi:phosphoglycerate dehydrogenase-like enzyme